MNTEPNPLESAFEPLKGSTKQDAGAVDQEINSFNDFFSRLNSLDEMSLSAQPVTGEKDQGEAQAGDLAPPLPDVTGSKPAAGSSSRGSMKVMRSHKVIPLEDLALAPPARLPSIKKAAVSSAAKSKPARPVTPGESEPAGPGIWQIARASVIAVVLFAVGVGGGWAALKLPGRFSDQEIRLSEILNGKNSAADEQMKDSSVLTADNGSGEKVAENGTPVKASQDKSSQNKAAPPVVEQGAEESVEADSAEDEASVEAPPAPELNPGSTAGLEPLALPRVDSKIKPPRLGNGVKANGTKAGGETSDSNMANGRAANKTAAKPSATAQTAPAENQAPAAVRSGYALQVGSCTSHSCVRKFRDILLARVSADSIQVISQQLDGDRLVQRIRIAPLDKEQAVRMKDDLARLDERFKGAYMVLLK
ncbi:MAG: hypothetical protein OEZ59_00040 [Deltaproteobacteria bacterium]|nr:hypothetical protein [Deltaproteobacteria bacterium]